MTQLYGSAASGFQPYGDGRPGLSFLDIRAQTSQGKHGAGLIFNDWDGHADDSVEVVIQILQPPGSGTLIHRRNGSATLSGAADGVWPFAYRLRIDGAPTAPVTSYFVVGSASLAVGDPALVPSSLSGSAGVATGKQRYAAAFHADKQLFGPPTTSALASATGVLLLSPASLSGTAYVSAFTGGNLELLPATLSSTASSGAVAWGNLGLIPAAVDGSAFVSAVVFASLVLDAATVLGSAAGNPSSFGSLSLAPATMTGSASTSGGPLVSGIYPDPSTVLSGVRYGPSGGDFVGTLSIPDAVSVAAAVRVDLATELLRLTELAQIHGLIPGVPLSVGPLTRVAGSIEQSISTSNGTTVVSRA